MSIGKRCRMVIGIDWDGTADRYFRGLSVLCKNAKEVHIISLNNRITVEDARILLGVPITGFHIMPDEAFKSANDVFLDIARWKHNVCAENNVDLMIDDEQVNVDYLLAHGIACIKCDGDWVQSTDYSGGM